MNRAQLLLNRFDTAEYGLCRRLNRGASARPLRLLLRVMSRLGDGPLWYLLIVLLPLLYGTAALRTSVAMAGMGLVGVVLYRWLKGTVVRERPFIRHPGIDLAMPPLDRYSFPSGHTLHAVAFTWLAVQNFPELAWVLVPVAVLIATSRVVLGLHYPSDVLAGGAIGAALALVAQNFV
ncbi:MAG TPA: phosphatase PAP2 family protein [Steroidobacteraceae bacterium]|nr:phosphatase PAP2 family protein [Steroidobacteraceae bacterium]